MAFEKLLKKTDANEKIIMVVRRHWFNILINLSSVFAMVLLLLGSYFYLPVLFPAANRAIPDAFFLFGENIFAMIIWILFFLIWIDYYFDVWIVTDKRIVNVEQRGLFSREISELKLEKIQDVSAEVVGIIPTFLNYGDVEIQTAGEESKFLFRQVPDPNQIKDLIMGLQKRREHQKTDELGEMIEQKIHAEKA